MILSIFNLLHSADFVDFSMMMIVLLLGFITYYSKRQVNRMDTFMRQNTADHMNMEKRMVDMDTWTKAVHSMEIEPTLKKSNQNEKEIIDIRMDIRNHEGRITKIEKKIG